MTAQEAIAQLAAEYDQGYITLEQMNQRREEFWPMCGYCSINRTVGSDETNTPICVECATAGKIPRNAPGPVAVYDPKNSKWASAAARHC